MVQIALQQGNPIVVGATPADMGGVVGIGEIAADGPGDINGEGTRAIGFIHHIDRDAAVRHQDGNGFLVLRRDRTRAVHIEHVSPVVGSLSEVGRQGLAVPLVAVLARTLNRPLPVFHQLGHSCGNATRGTPAWSVHIIG